MNHSLRSMLAALTALVAVAASAQTTWQNALNGNWDDDAKWSAGVPDGNHAYLTNTVGSYAVAVNLAPPSFTRLTLSNDPGQGVTLNVHADMDFGGVGVTLDLRGGSALHLRDGGALRCYLIEAANAGDVTVHSNASLRVYTLSDVRGFSGVVTVKAGGTWHGPDSFALHASDTVGVPGARVLIEEGARWNKDGTVYAPFNMQRSTEP